MGLRKLKPSKNTRFACNKFSLVASTSLILCFSSLNLSAKTSNRIGRPPQGKVIANGELKLGSPIQQVIGGYVRHVYFVRMLKGQYARVVVRQKGIDVVVASFDPNREKMDEVDSPNGTQGLEPVSLIAKTAGSYNLEVRSFRPFFARDGAQAPDEPAGEGIH